MTYDALDALDKLDQTRLKQHPKRALSKDWQSSRYLKKQVYDQNNHTLSLSHRKGHATILSSPTELGLDAGIDLEFMQERDFLSLSELFCTAEELHWLSKQNNLKHAFYLLWTLKESLIKAHHGSLADMKKFSFITSKSSKETLTIPTLNDIKLKGISFCPKSDWIISAVYSENSLANSKLILQGYGLWHDMQFAKTTLKHFQASNA